MDFQFETMTENGLAALVKAGCVVDVRIVGYGETARFAGKISKGGAQHGGPGFCLVIEGEGDDGAAALRGAVATAETFLHTVPPRRLLPLPEIPDATEARRIANRAHAAQDDERARELVDADEQGLGR